MNVSRESWVDRRRALLVAVSAYDDPELQTLYAPPGDAARLRDVLLNPGRGGISPADLTVLTNPDLAELQRALGQFAAESGDDELLILYFSGHALRGPGHEVFLACRDTVPSQPWTSALAGTVIHGLLDGAAARSQVVILDCCYAGGLHRGTEQGEPNSDGAVLAGALSARNGSIRRSVLAASGLDQEAWERQNTPPRNDHSLFTDALVAGLDSGDGDLDGDGYVSVSDLAGYVHRELQILTGGNQTPSLTAGVQWADRILLSRAPAGGADDRQVTRVSLLGIDTTNEPGRVKVRELDAPLQVLAAPITRLKDALSRMLPVAPGTHQEWLLNGITEMLGADLAFICAGDRWDLDAHSDAPDRDTALSEAAAAVARLRRAIDGTAGTTAGWFAKAGDVRTIAVPLTPSSEARWLFVVGRRMPGKLLIEPVATVCRAVCESHSHLHDPSPLRALGAAWDALRRRAGFVPQEIYRARRQAFEDQLKGIVPWFQPVLYLDGHPGIDSWEALARDPSGSLTEAPADLFAAAQLWGREFMLLLDRHMLRASVRSYRDQTRRAPRVVTGGPQPQGLTVNVYPDTLLHNDYFHELQELVQGPDGIQGRELALEISEKLPIPEPPPGVVWEKRPLEVFKERLGEYTRSFDVRLAIDDFGVGYGSLERLSGLSLTYVKLDQWFTEQQDQGLTINFVKALINDKSLGGDKVVLEGFNDRKPFTLEDAFALKVRFLQGGFVGAAAPELKVELEPERVARIRRAAARIARRPDRPGRITGGRRDGLPSEVPGFWRSGVGERE